MRIDATIDRKQVLLPNASTLGYGKYKAQAGDLISYREHYKNGYYTTRLARVIGHLDYAPALDGDTESSKNLLVVIALADIPSYCYERWVKPEDVIECISLDNPNENNLWSNQAEKIRNLLAFFLSPGFIKYSPDELRQWSTTGYSTMQQWKQLG